MINIINTSLLGYMYIMFKIYTNHSCRRSVMVRVVNSISKGAGFDPRIDSTNNFVVHLFNFINTMYINIKIYFVKI